MDCTSHCDASHALFASKKGSDGTLRYPVKLDRGDSIMVKASNMRACTVEDDEERARGILLQTIESAPVPKDCVCAECSQLVRSTSDECPICKSAIEHCFRVFSS